MKKMVKMMLALIVMFFAVTAVSFAEEKTIPANEIIPGGGYSQVAIDGEGRCFAFKDSMPKDILFCIEKNGRYECARWEGGILFTFLPVKGKPFPAFATGYSSDKEKFPVQEYELVPSEEWKSK